MVRKLILTATAVTALAAPMAITMTADAAPAQGPMPEICKVKNWPACDPWRR